MMRYWFEGVDEGLEREVDRRKKLGLPPPDTDPSFCHFLVFVLVVVQAILWLGMAGAPLVWLPERNTQLLLDSAITRCPQPSWASAETRSPQRTVPSG